MFLLPHREKCQRATVVERVFVTRMLPSHICLGSARNFCTEGNSHGNKTIKEKRQEYKFA